MGLPLTLRGGDLWLRKKSESHSSGPVLNEQAPSYMETHLKGDRRRLLKGDGDRLRVGDDIGGRRLGESPALLLGECDLFLKGDRDRRRPCGGAAKQGQWNGS